MRRGADAVAKGVAGVATVGHDPGGDEGEEGAPSKLSGAWRAEPGVRPVQAAGISPPAAKSPYTGYRFPAEVISHAVWLYFRFPLSLRMVEEMLAARGIVVSHETVRQWALKLGQDFANRIRRRLPCAGDKRWHLDEVAIKIAGVQHWLWRAVDQNGLVLDVLVQSRRDKRATKRLLRKLLKRQCRAPRVMITDKPAATARRRRS